ncbi:MAG: type II toxin-antitoxin system RelE/ParE family toxin [Kiritimatiellae bacterium]|nr:type II toxin-antitoxin system RelE/ParE family toxin [Kiritimatiellia bacterium]MCO5068724.1 type II toxin-antitoxin system RelE/ParE family toxin [Kiritimatiellia bacterium]
MAYNISYKSSVKRDLKKLNKADAKRVLDQLERDLSKNPLEYPALKGEFAGLRKYRVGDYRVIFAILNDEVIVLRIGDRKDVYR